MATNSLEDKLREAFAEGAANTFADAYYERVMSSWASHREQARRTAILIVVLIGVYELLARSQVAKASIGPVEVTDLSLFQKGLPVVLAYTGYQLMMTLADEEALAKLANLLTKVLYRPVWDRDLELYLRPPGSPIFLARPIIQPRRGRLARIIRSTRWVGITVLVTPTIFTVYCIINNFTRFGFSDLITWVSAIISIWFLSYGVALMIHGINVARPAE